MAQSSLRNRREITSPWSPHPLGEGWVRARGPKEVISCRFPVPSRRRGLAPIELVLWLPVLLFVLALLINYGTTRPGGSAARLWHDAAFQRVGQDRGERRPPGDSGLPGDDGDGADRPSRKSMIRSSSILSCADHCRMVSSCGGADRKKPVPTTGIAEVERGASLMARLGRYDSGEIARLAADRKWINLMGFQQAPPHSSPIRVVEPIRNSAGVSGRFAAQYHTSGVDRARSRRISIDQWSVS